MRRDLDERGMIPRRRIRRYLWSIAIFALSAVAVYFFAASYPTAARSGAPVYGKLDERFTPLLTLEKDGEEYQYYENFYTNVLVIGVDQESLEVQTRQRSGGQADFLLLLSINRDTRTITPVHIDRDTVTEAQIYGAFGDYAGTRRMQICLSHAFGETEEANSKNTAWAVSNLLRGIPVDYYVTMDMSGIAALNDALGGVTVTLTEDFSALDPEMTQGKTLTLKGRQAEYFVRGRHRVGDFSNRQRMNHQQEFISAAIPLVHERIKNEKNFLVSLYDELRAHLCSNLSSSWLSEHAYAMEKYRFMSTRTLAGEHVIGEDGFVEFHADAQALDALLIDVFLRKK